MAAEISAAKRERDFYMSRVDRAKAEEAKDERRKVCFTSLALQPCNRSATFQIA